MWKVPEARPPQSLTRYLSTAVVQSSALPLLGLLSLRAAMSTLKAGVIVTKLDRLGRSTWELLDLIERIGAADASFKSLGDPLWDTTSSQGRLLSTLLAAIAVLSGS
jgi:hypothetical protein